jgi:hypothetical protein
MSLCEGEVNPGDKDKVIRYEKKLRDWERDVVNGQSNKKPEANKRRHVVRPFSTRE